MTVQAFFDLLATHPSYLLAYFIGLPVLALIIWWIAKGEAHKKPWPNIYCVLVYLACIPGIFALVLNVYSFLFDRRGVYDMDIYTQILPILSMIFTLWAIRKNISFDAIPGFDKLSTLLVLMFCLIGIMWVVDKTHIIAISYVPIWAVLLVFFALLLTMVFGTRRLFR